MNPLTASSQSTSLIQHILKKAILGAWDDNAPNPFQQRFNDASQDLTSQITQLHAYFQTHSDLRQRIDAAILQELKDKDKPALAKAARMGKLSLFLGLLGLPLAFGLGIVLTLMQHLGH